MHTAQLEHIVMFGNRNVVKHLGDVPRVLDQFQLVFDDYEEVTGEDDHDATSSAVVEDSDP